MPPIQPLNSARFHGIRWALLALLLPFCWGCRTEAVRSSIPEIRRVDSAPSPTIVIGFVGFFNNGNDLNRSVVKLGEKLRRSDSRGLYVATMANRREKQAQQTILQLLDANGDGIVSDEEKQDARIILYGHSWGGSAVVSLARRLEKDQVPVLLTVQIDSVRKLGQNDAVIPPNVLYAANFFQGRGFIHGRRSIRAEDPSRTEVLGNFPFDYRNASLQCPNSRWYDMAFARGHTQLECDPLVWTRVESLIREYTDTQNAALPPARTQAAQPDKRDGSLR